MIGQTKERENIDVVWRRNNTLEMLKLFAAYMVVFLHVPFYGTFGVAVNALARFAVPFFFFVSGFFSYRITPKKIKHRIAHLVFVLVFAILVCTACKLSEALMKQGFQGIIQYFRQYLKLDNVLKLVLFNKTIHVEYLWYLFSILYVYILLYFATVFGMKDKLYWAIALTGLCIQLILGEFLSIFGIVIPNYLLRNFALMGIPFFGLGMLASKYRHKLADVPSAVIIVLIMIGMLETLVSRFSFGINELHVGSVLILFALAVVCIKYPDKEYPGLLTALSGCNTYIYILHPIISGIMVNMYALLGVHSGWSGYIALRMMHPLMVCVVSTAAAFILNKILPGIEKKIKQAGAA